MFLQVCVILFTGRGCLPQCMLGYHTPPGADTPLGADTTPLGADTTPLGADTPRSRHPSPRSRHPSPRSRHPPGADPLGVDTPWEQTPPGADTPRNRPPPPPPPQEADYGIQSTSGRYASYWNAFLLSMKFLERILTYITNLSPPGWVRSGYLLDYCLHGRHFAYHTTLILCNLLVNRMKCFRDVIFILNCKSWNGTSKEIHSTEIFGLGP